MAAAPGSGPGNAMSQQMGSNLSYSLMSCRAVRGTTCLSVQFRPNTVTSSCLSQAARARPHSVRSVALLLGFRPQQEWSESSCLASPIQSWRTKATDMKASFCTFRCNNFGAGHNLDRTSAWNGQLRCLPTADRIIGELHVPMRPDSERKFLLPSSYYISTAAPGSFGAVKVGKSGKYKGWKKHPKVGKIQGNALTTEESSKVSKGEKISKRKSMPKKLKEEENADTKVVVLEEEPRVKEALVIVESPAKAKAIEKYLGDKFLVVASYGHVRDLASRAGSVRPDENFQMVWEVSPSAQQHLNSMKSALAMANSLILASDPDREGEAIAWHVLEMLTVEGAIKSHHVIKRVVFHEITQSAVLRAMESPREISDSLVSAYLARRALDYIIGFDLSPLLWRKLPGSKSAGRVQSAALRLITERETEIEAFTPQEYWSVDAQVSLSPAKKKALTADRKILYPARLTHYMGEKIGQFSLTTETAAAAAKRVKESKLVVSSVNSSIVRRTPPAPYITSTLQQDASNKLSFSASRTMALAQQLYEGVKIDNDEVTGLITYMRTDSVQMSGDAVQTIRSIIEERYGETFLPPRPRVYLSKSKNAQEAHEAIRPTDARRIPSSLENVLPEDALQLYSLIWCRAVICQMEQATFNQVTADIVNDDNSVELRCSGSVLVFPGFRAVHKDKEALAAIQVETLIQDDDEGDNLLPTFQPRDGVVVKQVQPNQHFTEPPPRFSEGSLVKKLEELGIGRPSTYASIMRTLQARAYVKIVKRRIFPEIRGRMVSVFLCKYFEKFVNYEFTANLESQLDEISAGRLEWKTFLSNFWPHFHEAVGEAMSVPIEQVAGIIEETFSKHLFPDDGRQCPRCREGTLSMKLSRYGAGYFLGCSRFPECHYKASAFKGDDEDGGQAEVAQPAPLLLGVDSGTGLEVYEKRGPFGRYIQVGQGPKPIRRAVPENFEQLTLECALELLDYPKTLGDHPDDGAAITLSLGRKKYLIRHKGLSVGVPEGVAPEAVTFEFAVQLIKLLGGSRPGRRSSKISPEAATITRRNTKRVKDLCKAATEEAKLRKSADVENEVETPAEAENTSCEIKATRRGPRRSKSEPKVLSTESPDSPPEAERKEEVTSQLPEGGGKVRSKVNSRTTDAGKRITKSRKAEPAIVNGDALASSSQAQVPPEVIEPPRRRGRPKLVRAVA